MKSWCDLSWREKCKINNGETNSFKYLCGYDFRVKTKVREGIENAKDTRTKLRKTSGL